MSHSVSPGATVCVAGFGLTGVGSPVVCPGDGAACGLVLGPSSRAAGSGRVMAAPDVPRAGAAHSTVRLVRHMAAAAAVRAVGLLRMGMSSLSDR
ncbi:hypothetical protein GCM10023083_55280 [Streptomyces phyllanthi]